MSKTRTREMWILADKDEDINDELYSELDGGLYATNLENESR